MVRRPLSAHRRRGPRRTHTRRIVALRIAVITAAIHAVLTVSPAPAADSPGTPPSRRLTFSVSSRGGIASDLGVFARTASRTFNDRRGWSLGGSLRFTHVRVGGDFTLWLASPSAASDFAPACTVEYSCRVGDDVIINEERWRQGSDTWPNVREYRSYVLTHELGHWLGLGHVDCPGPGAPAPVMAQQSIALNGCVRNTWPLAGERSTAASNTGVAVRPLIPDVHVVKLDGPQRTEMHILDGAAFWDRFQLHVGTAQHDTNSAEWQFDVGDFNVDGVNDLYVIKQRGATGTEVHVLDGASDYRSWALHTATPLHTTGENWRFKVDDFDGDGYLDVYAMNRLGATGTEVHILNGAVDYQGWLAHLATPQHQTGEGWQFGVGDYDRDGVPDVYLIAQHGASGTTEVHILDGRRDYGGWLLHTATALETTGENWDFDARDQDGDGFDDVFAINRAGGSGTSEVHVLDNDTAFRSWLVQTATAQHPTTDDNWAFAVG